MGRRATASGRWIPSACASSRRAGISRCSATIPTSAGSLLVLAELGEDREVFERGGVAGGLAAGGDVLQEAAHDLAAAGLGERVREADRVGARELADLLGDVLA